MAAIIVVLALLILRLSILGWASQSGSKVLALPLELCPRRVLSLAMPLDPELLWFVASTQRVLRKPLFTSLWYSPQRALTDSIISLITSPPTRGHCVRS